MVKKRRSGIIRACGAHRPLFAMGAALFLAISAAAGVATAQSPNFPFSAPQLQSVSAGNWMGDRANPAVQGVRQAAFAQPTPASPAPGGGLPPVRPPVLSGPELLPPATDFLSPSGTEPEMLRWPAEPPLGYTGPSGVAPRDFQENSHFVPLEDRWRIGFPEWDRYGKGHPDDDEYPYVTGERSNPYQQNALKGDYPFLGQNNFFILTASNNLILEGRQVPTPTTPFESTVRPNSEEFFGDPDQYFMNNNMIVSTEWNHGDGAFKPADWRIKLTNIFNLNHLVVDELGIVSPDVRKGTGRFREDYALEEWFFESKLADFGPDYDFASVRAGSQFFASDFRGFIFADTNRAVRLFGTRFAKRDQFNLVYFDQTEKETNSLLNTYDDRHQNT
jgi:hypothetical protein